MKKSSYIVALLTMLLVSQISFSKGNIAAGAKKLESLKGAPNNCETCHTADGNSTIATYPKLAGQHESYLVKQLEDFKSGKRKGVMSAMVGNLSATDIQDLSAYFASQKVKVGNAKSALVVVGRKLYEGGNPTTKVPACMGCHGPAGKGNVLAKFPALGGQHAAYTAAQIKDFRKAARAWVKNNEAQVEQPKQLPGRENDMDRMMQHVVLYISDAEIEAVSSYIQGLYSLKKTAKK